MVYVSQHPGFLAERSVIHLGERLNDDPDALGLLNEIINGIKEPAKEAISEALSAVRGVVYTAGLAKGADNIATLAQTLGIEEQRKEGLTDPLRQETAEEFAERIRIIRTEIALRALAALSKEAKDSLLGPVRARHLKINTAEIFDLYFGSDEHNLPKRTVSERTPTNELLGIVALSEDPNYSDIDAVQRLRSTAIEFLIRRLVSANPGVARLAAKFLKFEHFEQILEARPDSLARGRTGGKAGGLILAYAALEHEDKDFDESFAENHGFKNTEELHEKLQLEKRLKPNRQFLIGSRVFEDIVRANPSLGAESLLKSYYTNGDQPPTKLHEQIQSALKSAKIPEHIERQLRRLYLEVRKSNKPSIVRSSSELEDMLGSSFAGQYESVEIANAGTEEENFKKFIDAILKVYASVYAQKVFGYRADHGLIWNDEEMGIVVQDINGCEQGPYFCPDFAAVAMSYTPFSIGGDPKRGAMTVVAGLGEQAVNEGGKFAMFDRPNANTIPNWVQGKLIAIDRKNNTKIKIEAPKIVKFSEGIRRFGEEIDTYERRNYLNCKWLVTTTDLPLVLEYITAKLKHLFGNDVDCEFTIQIKRSGDPEKDLEFEINLVQCRPQNISPVLKPSKRPKEVPAERVLIETEGSLTAIRRQNITHAIYIDEKALGSSTLLADVRDYVSTINQRFKKADGQFLIVTPKRWGSENPEAGVKVDFSHFNHAGTVVERFTEPDANCSFGTHFGQCLIEKGIGTLSCVQNSEIRRKDLKTEFFENADHCSEMPKVPANLKDIIKVVDINKEAAKSFGKKPNGWVLHVASDNCDFDRPASIYFAGKDEDLPLAA